TFSDPDPTSVVTLTSNVASVLPGATTALVPGNPAVLTICWTVDQSLLPATFQISATDDDCPFPNAAYVDLTIVEAAPPVVPPHAGTGTQIGTCPSQTAPIPLFPLLADSPHPTGQWTAPDGTIHSGTFDPLGDPVGDYLYIVGSACEADTAVITVTPDPGAHAGQDTLWATCSIDTPTDLFPLLGPGAQTTGTWTGPNGAFNGTFDPATDPPGAYVYSVSGVPPCPDHSATVQVVVNPVADARADAAITLCSNAAPGDLFTLPGGAPQSGGIWSGPNGALSGTVYPA